MCSIKFASLRLAFPMHSGVPVSVIIKGLFVLGRYEMLYTHTDVHSNWNILEALVMQTHYIYNISPFYFIWDIFIFLMRAKSEKLLKICMEQSSMIICNCHLFCSSDVYGVTFMTDHKSCFWVHRNLVWFVCYMKGTFKIPAFSLSFLILSKFKTQIK